jgi:hypothetical protein
LLLGDLEWVQCGHFCSPIKLLCVLFVNAA